MGKPFLPKNRTRTEDPLHPEAGQETPATNPVRQPEADRSGTPLPDDAQIAPAHASVRFPVQLNEGWRVVDDPLQWILQRKSGEPRQKSTGWRGHSFCATRNALLRCIREYCGKVDPRAVAELERLPAHHRDMGSAK